MRRSRQPSVPNPMARAQKLKVYRTPIGFHDAYVAAPSQKAALEAWGSDANLFTRGVAELVSDEALTKEPLASPGKVIKRLRGTADEQNAALRSGRDGGRSRTKKRGDDPEEPPTERKAKPKPRPSRAALDEAEQALDALLKAQRREDADLLERQRAFDLERKRITQEHERARKTAEKHVETARKAHSAALDRWLEDQG
ncbi:hypothetical protein [Sphingomonas sp. ID0503]|uniref:hypothetical protein n=1 Tax=Sphingomonas sp. ID0503 TaxID=3399691 RepID=UPI003AFA9283